MPITSDVWERLPPQLPEGPILQARIIDPAATERLLAAQDADGRRHLLVTLQSDDPAIEDRQSRGLSVATRTLVIPDHPPGRFVDIVCLESAGHEAFNLVGGEISQRLATGLEQPAKIVQRVLASWRRFWGQLPSLLLSRDQIHGLFAELWFLTVWLAPRAGIAEAVRRWRGPMAARHDFEWEGMSIEVKATTSTRGRVHRIHGIDQLSPPENGRLLLFSVQLREEGGATNSLPSIIAGFRALAASDPNTLNAFDDLIAHAGYVELHEMEYSKTRFRIVSEGLFRVEGNFPRVTRAIFPGSEVPPGVEHIDYDINLDGCEMLLEASHSSDFALGT